MTNDEPKRFLSLEELEEEAARRKFSDDPEVEALRNLKLSELRAIAEDDEDPRQAAASKAISIAMKPLTSMTNDWVSSWWASTDVAKSVRNSLLHSGLMPKFKLDIPDFKVPYPATPGRSRAGSDDADEQNTAEPDSTVPEMTAAELAATSATDILQGIRTEAERTNERLLEVIDGLAKIAQSSQDAAATARQDAADARADARKSHRSAWIGIWVAVAVGVFSVGATIVSAVLASTC